MQVAIFDCNPQPASLPSVALAFWQRSLIAALRSFATLGSDSKAIATLHNKVVRGSDLFASHRSLYEVGCLQRWVFTQRSVATYSLLRWGLRCLPSVALAKLAQPDTTLLCWARSSLLTNVNRLVAIFDCNPAQLCCAGQKDRCLAQLCCARLR